MTKRVLSFLMALMLLCGISSIAAAEEPVTMSIVTTRRTTDITESYSQKVWVQELEKACNVKINWVELTEGQVDEPLTATLASATLPDIFWTGKAMTDGIVSQNTKLWHVITEDEIKTYMPNLYNFYETYVDGWRENQTYPDGNIYSLPGGKMHSRMHVTKGIQYINTKWLERVGMEMPTTMEEFHKVLVAFRDMDANGNGDPNDEIPFTGIGLGMDFLSPFGMTDVYGQRYLVNDDGTVRYAYTSEEYKEGIKWAHKLYQDGLIDNELFTQNDQIRDAKCDDPNVSRVGFCYAWSYDAIFRNWKDEYKVIAPIAGPDGQRYQQGDLNGLYSLKSNQLSITTVCKHPEVVLRWADQFYTGEASIQNFWGGLGEVTTANADGTYTLNNPPAGTSADAWYWDRSLRDFGPKYCSIEFDKKIILDPTEGDGLKVAMDAETAQYVRPCFPELKYTADEYNELSFLQADIDTYVDTTRAHWVADGGIDEEWDAYVEQLKNMGLEDMNKIYEGAYARYLAAQD